MGQRFCGDADNEMIRTVSLQRTAVEDVDFDGITQVLHLAGIAHRMEKTEDALYFRVNHELTRQLAIRAKDSGVKHFIFMSTIKVYGNEVEHLSLDTVCVPDDAYGKSKLMAEEAILALSSDSFIVSVIRPPLIYGPGVKGNIDRLLKLLEKRKIVPFGKIENKRSIVAVDNLIALIMKILETRSQGIFLIQDKEPVSTSDLLKSMAMAKGLDTKLVSIPGILRKVIKVLKPEIYKRVFGSLVVDDSDTRKKLDFSPPLSMDEGMEIMIKESKDA